MNVPETILPPAGAPPPAAVPSRCPATPGDPPPGCAHAVPPAIRSFPARLGLYLVLFIASQVVGAFVTAGILGIFNHDLLDERGVATFLGRSLVPLTIVSTLLGILVTLLWWRRIDRRPLAALGIPSHPGVPGEIARGLLAAVWLMTLASLPALLSNWSQVRFLPGGPEQFLLSLAPYGVAFLLVALNEELSFRGYILMNLILKVKPWVAVVVTSVLFAGMHVFNPNLAPIGYLNLHLAGALFAFSVLRWGSLWYAIAFHFAWNLYQAVVLALPVSGVRVPGLLDVPVSGPAWLTGGSFGPEGSIVTTLLLGIACWRMASGLPVRLDLAPVPPPCASGEDCPLVPEEIAAAARRGRAGEISAGESPGT